MTTYDKHMLKQAHMHCTYNREAISASRVCGCFYCQAIYAATEVNRYTPGGRGKGPDAVCPRCGIDSVLPDASGLDLSPDFLAAMEKMWFGDEEDEA